MRNEERRKVRMFDVAPENWDKLPGGLASEIVAFLKSVRDEGTSLDTGMGDGMGDIWVTVQGIEYFICIRKSNKQLAKEGKPIQKIDLPEIEAAKTPRGGWTRATLARWGIAWPPPKGWKKRLLAQGIEAEGRDAASRLGAEHESPTPRSGDAP